MSILEKKAKYTARAVQLLQAAQAKPERAAAAGRLEHAEACLHQSKVQAMETVLSLYSEICDTIESDFPDDDHWPTDYMEDHSLNILQGLVEMCMPRVTNARAVGYVLLQAHYEGYDSNLEEFGTDFYDGLEDAVTEAEDKLGGELYFRYYSAEDEFPWPATA
jgi:hypothetical protein